MTGYKGQTGSSAPTEQRKGCGGETAGRCTPRVLVSLRFTAWASPPTDEQRGCGGSASLPPARLRFATHNPVCTPRVLASRRALGRLAEGGEGEFRACGRGGRMWASAPTHGYRWSFRRGRWVNAPILSRRAGTGSLLWERWRHTRRPATRRSPGPLSALRF